MSKEITVINTCSPSFNLGTIPSCGFQDIQLEFEEDGEHYFEYTHGCCTIRKIIITGISCQPVIINSELLPICKDIEFRILNPSGNYMKAYIDTRCIDPCDEGLQPEDIKCFNKFLIRTSFELCDESNKNDIINGENLEYCE